MDRKQVTPLDFFRQEHVTEEEKEARYAQCRQCEYFMKATKQCKLCGCFMPAKTAIKNAFCPKGVW